MSGEEEKVKLGTNSFGPSGWVAVGGTALNAVIYVLSQKQFELPDPWNTVFVVIVAVLTVLGVYKAPGVVQK